MGLLFLGKVHGLHLKPKYEVFPEWNYKILPRDLIWNNICRRYTMVDVPGFLSPKHPFLLEQLSNLSKKLGTERVIPRV